MDFASRVSLSVSDNILPFLAAFGIMPSFAPVRNSTFIWLSLDLVISPMTTLSVVGGTVPISSSESPTSTMS